MSARLLELTLRRERLVARAAAERTLLVAHGTALVTPGGAIHRALSIGAAIKAHPWWLLAAAAAVVLIRPRRIARLVGPGMMLWRVWRLVRAWMKPAAAA